MAHIYKHPEELVRKVLAAAQDTPVPQVAKKFGIHQSSVYTWIKKSKGATFKRVRQPNKTPKPLSQTEESFEPDVRSAITFLRIAQRDIQERGVANKADLKCLDALLALQGTL